MAETKGTEPALYWADEAKRSKRPDMPDVAAGLARTGSKTRRIRLGGVVESDLRGRDGE